jgi:hypothetical protein
MPVPGGKGRRPVHCLQCQHVLAATVENGAMGGEILSGTLELSHRDQALREFPPTHARNPIDGTTRSTARRAALNAPLWGARRKPHPKGADTLRNNDNREIGNKARNGGKAKNGSPFKVGSELRKAEFTKHH